MGEQRDIVRFLSYQKVLSTHETIISSLAGQMCIASSRVYVQESVYDQFLEAFTKRAQDIKLGGPFQADVFQGPQISKGQFDVRPNSD